MNLMRPKMWKDMDELERRMAAFVMFNSGGGGGGQAYVSAGMLSAPFTFGRNHSPTTVGAYAVASDGVSLDSYAENVARYNGTARRLLIEGARTNLLLNTAALSTQDVTVTAVEHTMSFYGTGTITLTGVSTAGPLVGTGATDRVSLTFTPTAGTLTCTVSGSVTRAQIGIGAFASTYIQANSGGTGTRGADIVTASLASLGIPANGACTILATVRIPQNATASAAQEIFRIDDGTENNRYRFFNAAASAIIRAQRVTGGAASTADPGSMVAGTLFRFGAAIDGAGRAAASFNGAAVVAVTGGPASGLTTMRIGGAIGGVECPFGEIGTLKILRGVLNDADLAARVAVL